MKTKRQPCPTCQGFGYLGLDGQEVDCYHCDGRCMDPGVVIKCKECGENALYRENGQILGACEICHKCPLCECPCGTFEEDAKP